MKGENPLNQPTITNWLDLPPIPATPHTMTKGEIHLWLIHLEAPAETLAACAAVLSPDETARAERFRLPHLRTRYSVTRGAVRQILASYLDTTPEALEFHYTPQGKPSVANETRLTFNVSHSQDLALLAITTHDRLGIDLEHRDPHRDLDQIATRNFTPGEAHDIASLPEDQRTCAFYACWTLKEAYLKATGDGLSTPLDSFKVHCPPVAPPAIASPLNQDPHWQAFSFTLEAHAIALVVEGEDHSIHRAIWHSQSGHAP